MRHRRRLHPNKRHAWGGQTSGQTNQGFRGPGERPSQRSFNDKTRHFLVVNLRTGKFSTFFMGSVACNTLCMASGWARRSGRNGARGEASSGWVKIFALRGKLLECDVKASHTRSPTALYPSCLVRLNLVTHSLAAGYDSFACSHKCLRQLIGPDPVLISSSTMSSQPNFGHAPPNHQWRSRTGVV